MRGNTLVVVEHDPAVMLAADRMIDMGPGPGERWAAKSCLTVPRPTCAVPTRSLAPTWAAGKHVGFGFKRHGDRHPPRASSSKARASTTCKNVSVEFPLQRLVCVTGVSGSGKSSA